MRWTTCFCLSLLSFCCFASLRWTSAAVTSTTEPESAEVEETTEGASPEPWEHPRMCYVEKSKVDELIVRMNSTVRVLNRDDEYLECGEKLKIVEADNMEFCTEERIRRVQKDLFEVAGSLFKLAVRLTEPSAEEVNSLDLKKIRLIHDLNALLVFYGPSPCDSHSIALFPFASLVEHLEWNLDQIFVLFQTSRPIRPPPPTTPAPSTTTSKPTVEDMLNTEKSLTELAEMAELNPAAMSKAVPQIISQRYNERTSTFDKLVTFVQGLLTNENKIFGFAAIHDEMYRYKRNPDMRQLLKLKDILNTLNVSSESASPNFAGAAASVKLADLIQDLSSVQTTVATTTSTTQKPVFDRMLNPEISFAELILLAKSNPSLISKALPQIVSQRYSRRVSTFDSLLDFVNAMPTSEDKIIGFSAVYDEMHGHNQKPGKLQLEKLAKNVKLVIASTPTSINVAARSKLKELTEDHDLGPLIFKLRPEWSLQELADWAQLNSSATSIVLPEIISERYNASDSQFESYLNFVEGLPTTENKIIGFAAIRDEMHRHGRTLNLAQLLKLAKKVKMLNEDDQTASASTLAKTATSLKWTNLIRELSPLMAIGEKAECQVTNVAYGTQLTATDRGWPRSAYVHQNQSSKGTWPIYPAIQNNKLVFRIGYTASPFFASDKNTNPDRRNTYQTKTSERYVLLERVSYLLFNAEINWKIVPVPNKANQFRILSAKSDDFMFAHESATGFLGLRRVLLGRKSFTDHDHILDADLWTLDCKPGTSE